MATVRQELPNGAILFTFRTKEEGGETEVPESYYFDLIDYAIKSGKIDAVDVEYFRDRASIEKVLAVAKEHGVTVIMSNHDFDKTPSFDEITGRLMGMKKLGADVAKLACMPNSAKDVLTSYRQRKPSNPSIPTNRSSPCPWENSAPSAASAGKSSALP